MNGRRGSRICWALSCLWLTGCTTQAPAPIEGPVAATAAAAPRIVATPNQTRGERPAGGAAGTIRNGRYVVRRGDTLHAIAWRLGLDHRRLIDWNNLQNPDRIFVGQSLLVVAPDAGGEARPAAPPPRTGAPAATMKLPAEVKSPVRGPLRGWVWPADGAARRSMSATGSTGLQISGERGQPVRAAETGEVVYAGSGLRGYGQLLILKHDEVFLSAYAHNEKLLVAEGQRVERGQPIALMGSSGASEVMLHFEIRKGGKAVDPTRYLPRR